MELSGDAPELESLFPELEARRPVGGKPGRCEALLLRSIQAGMDAGILVTEDWGLIGGALVAARGLDVAEMGGRGGGPYAIAALLTPYRECCQALRLPAEVAPAEQPRPAAPGPSDASSLLGDLFGTAQPPG